MNIYPKISKMNIYPKISKIIGILKYSRRTLKYLKRLLKILFKNADTNPCECQGIP